MSENRLLLTEDSKNAILTEIGMDEHFYFSDITLKSLSPHSANSSQLFASPLARIAALSFQSKRIRPSSVPLNKYARRILLSVLEEIQTLPRLTTPSVRRISPAETIERGIPYKPALWDDVPFDNARRQAYSRATQWLQKLGFIRRITEGRRNRATHLQLTASGLQLALWLAGRRVDRVAIAEGLRLTNWGRELADKMRFKPRQRKQNVFEKTEPQ